MTISALHRGASSQAINATKSKSSTEMILLEAAAKKAAKASADANKAVEEQKEKEKDVSEGMKVDTTVSVWGPPHTSSTQSGTDI